MRTYLAIHHHTSGHPVIYLIDEADIISEAREIDPDVVDVIDALATMRRIDDGRVRGYRDTSDVILGGLGMSARSYGRSVELSAADCERAIEMIERREPVAMVETAPNVWRMKQG